MKGKSLAYIILLVMLITALMLRRHSKNSGSDTVKDRTASSENDQRGFKRNVFNLEYTRHAACRMECRHVTKNEVENIMEHGSINYRKSDLKDRPCPTYALEGFSQQDHQHLRIVFAQCDEKTKVVTCIDLENDYTCDCK